MNLDFSPVITIKLSLQEAASLHKLLQSTTPTPIGNSLISELGRVFDGLTLIAASSREGPTL